MTAEPTAAEIEAETDEIWQIWRDAPTLTNALRTIGRRNLMQRGVPKPEDVAEVERVARDARMKDPLVPIDVRIAHAVIARYGAPPAAATPPVGTIVCGEGLTPAQENYSGELKLQHAGHLKAAKDSLMGVTWHGTAEGDDFWGAVYERLSEMHDDFRASATKPKPKPIVVRNMQVAQSDVPGMVILDKVGFGNRFTPDEARALADALRAQADAAEGDAP